MTTKPHANGTWTDARKKSFIVSALRKALVRWPPKSKCLADARVERGMYECNHCKEIVPYTTENPERSKPRIKNIAVDHVWPIVNPSVGFTDYDEWIVRAFVEVDKLQVLCKGCHDSKTKGEREVAKERRRGEQG